MTEPNRPVLDLLTEADTAQALGVKPDTLRRWRNRKVGPAYIRLGRGSKWSRVRYLVADLEAWIASRRREPGRRDK